MDELERFKTEINLTEFAVSLGYQLDRRKSSRSSIVMRNAEGDKVIITRKDGGHWTYFSVRESRDHGSIIDFLRFREGINLGGVRNRLRPWISGMAVRPDVSLYAGDVHKTVKDRGAVQAAWSAATETTHNRYLTFRGIRQQTLQDSRFSGCVRQDGRGNTLFAHYDQEGLTGYEIKNFEFTGFARHGEKAVWRSAANRLDCRLVMVEAALDGLSYHQLMPDQGTRYISIAGQISPHQLDVVRAEISSMAVGSTIVLGFDHDHEGELFALRFRNLVPGYQYLRHAPDSGKDWNDVLTKKSAS